MWNPLQSLSRPSHAPARLQGGASIERPLPQRDQVRIAQHVHLRPGEGGDLRQGGPLQVVHPRRGSAAERTPPQNSAIEECSDQP